jgi:hypothetical protein
MICSASEVCPCLMINAFFLNRFLTTAAAIILACSVVKDENMGTRRSKSMLDRSVMMIVDVPSDSKGKAFGLFKMLALKLPVGRLNK